MENLLLDIIVECAHNSQESWTEMCVPIKKEENLKQRHLITTTQPTMHTAIFYNKIQGWHILMPSIFQYMSKCKDLKLRHITADTNKPNKISDMLYQSSTNHVQIRHILVWQQTFTTHA